MSWCPVCITWGTDWLRCWCRTVSHRYRHHWMCRMPARLCRGSTPDETREAAVADNYHLGGPSLCAPVSQWEAADVVWRPMRLRGQAVLHPSLLSLLWAPVQLVMLPTAHWWLAHHCQLSSQSIADQSSQSWPAENWNTELCGTFRPPLDCRSQDQLRDAQWVADELLQ